MSDDINKALREGALDKIRKLLALAKDGGATEAEAASAARQAEKMMRAHQVAESEVTMKELEQDELFEQAYDEVSPDVRKGQRPKVAPQWAGFIAVGVAKAFVVKMDLVGTIQGVKVRFSGYAPDVQMASWIYQYLTATVFRLSRQYGDRGSSSSFRLGASIELQKRLYAIAAEREQENQAPGNSTALVLYDRKQERVDEMFGKMETEQKKTSAVNPNAYHAGKEAGRTMQIHRNRPIEGQPEAKKVGQTRQLKGA